MGSTPRGVYGRVILCGAPAVQDRAPRIEHGALRPLRWSSGADRATAVCGSSLGRLRHGHAGSVTVRPVVSDARSSGDVAPLTQRAYEAVAERYRARWHRVDALATERTTFAAQLPPGARVLDAGCGTGRDVLALVEAGIDAVGLDRSPAMLATPGLSGRVVVADLRAIPLPRGCVDGWWAAASLLHLDVAGVRATLAELWRISRAGAVGFVSVKRGDGEAWEGVEAGQARYVCYWRPGELDGELAAAGWTIERAWTGADPLGRRPWLSRFVRRAPEAAPR